VRQHAVDHRIAWVNPATQ